MKSSDSPVSRLVVTGEVLWRSLPVVDPEAAGSWWGCWPERWSPAAAEGLPSADQGLAGVMPG